MHRRVSSSRSRIPQRGGANPKEGVQRFYCQSGSAALVMIFRHYICCLLICYYFKFVFVMAKALT